MAYLKNKALFFTTSPRTPSKMIPEIQLLGEHFSGCKWDKQTQIAFIDLLAKSGFFEGSGSQNNKDFSARDRINRAPKALGFVDLSPHEQELKIRSNSSWSNTAEKIKTKKEWADIGITDENADFEEAENEQQA